MTNPHLDQFRNAVGGDLKEGDCAIHLDWGSCVVERTKYNSDSGMVLLRFGENFRASDVYRVKKVSDAPKRVSLESIDEKMDVILLWIMKQNVDSDTREKIIKLTGYKPAGKGEANELHTEV